MAAVNLVVLACVLRAVTKKRSTFSRKKFTPMENPGYPAYAPVIITAVCQKHARPKSVRIILFQTEHIGLYLFSFNMHLTVHTLRLS